MGIWERNTYETAYKSIDAKLSKDDLSYFQFKTWLERNGYLERDMSKIKTAQLRGKVEERKNKFIKEMWERYSGEAVDYEERKGAITKKVSKGETAFILGRDVMYKGKKYRKGSRPPDTLPPKIYKIGIQKTRPIKYHRAEYGVKINGKWYRKGQFLPLNFRG